MSHRLPFIRRFTSLGLAAAFALPLAIGCAGGPSQQELSLLEERRMAAESAETKVTELKAQKARLERRIADRKAEKAQLEQKLQAVRSAVANWPQN